MDKNLIVLSYLNSRKEFDEHIRSPRTKCNVIVRIKKIYDDYIYHLEEINYNRQNSDILSSRILNFDETRINYNNCINDLHDKYKVLENNNEKIKKDLDDTKNPLIPLLLSKNQQLFDCNSKYISGNSETDFKIKNSIDINYLRGILCKLNGDHREIVRNREENYIKKNIQENILNDITGLAHQALQNEEKIFKLKENKALLKKSIRVAKIYSKLVTTTIDLKACINEEIMNLKVPKNTNKLPIDDVLYLDEYSSLDFVDCCLKESRYNHLLNKIQSNKLCITKSIIDSIYESITKICYTMAANVSENVHCDLLNICCEYYKSIMDYNMTIICLLQISKYNQAAKLTAQYNLDAKNIGWICNLIDNEKVILKYISLLCGLKKLPDKNISKLKWNYFKLFLDIIKEVALINEIKSCRVVASILQEMNINEMMNLSNCKDWLYISEICLRNNFNYLGSEIIICYTLIISAKNIKKLKNNS